MTLERRIASAFGMTDAVWMRHASPWSVGTRWTCLPLLILAIWSRTWIGRWSLVPIAAAVLWTWLNPRVFPPPRSTDNWASKGVFGERLWIDRHALPIPDRHRVVPHVLNGVAAAGGLMVVWGLVALDPWPTLAGARSAPSASSGTSTGWSGSSRT